MEQRGEPVGGLSNENRERRFGRRGVSDDSGGR